MLNPRCKLPVAQTLRSSGWQPYCHSYLRKTIPWHHLVGYLRGKKIITLYLSSVLPYKNWGEAGSTSPVPAGPAPPAHGARRWRAATALPGCAAAPCMVLFFLCSACDEKSLPVAPGYDMMFICLWGTGHDLLLILCNCWEWLISRHALKLQVDEQMIIGMFLRLLNILFSLKEILTFSITAIESLQTFKRTCWFTEKCHCKLLLFI